MALPSHTPVTELAGCAARCAQGLWFSFPIIFILARTLGIPLIVEEWCWTGFDFLGKVGGMHCPAGPHWRASCWIGVTSAHLGHT